MSLTIISKVYLFQVFAYVSGCFLLRLTIQTRSANEKNCAASIVHTSISYMMMIDGSADSGRTRGLHPFESADPII